MKRKIFSKLLMVALVIAAVGSFVSCKDYDDDINNLQKQIDAKAAISELTALQSTLDSKIAAAQSAAHAAQATADAAATKTAVADLKTALEAAIADAKKAGTDAGTQAGQAITAANKAQETADGAAAAAKKADEDAKAALADALKTISETYATKAEAAAASTAAADAATAAAEAKAAIEKLGDTYFTIAEAEKLQEQVNNLKADLESAIDDKIDAKIKEVNNAVASVDAIWSAVTSVDLVASELADPNGTYVLNLQYGKEVSNVFGNKTEINAYAKSDDPKTFVKGDSIKAFNDYVIRVSPVNATVNASDIQLINSKGEEMTEFVDITVEKYNDLITRANETGLWRVTINLKDDVKAADVQKSVHWNKTNETAALYAIAINNTATASEGRFAVSQFDLKPVCKEYEPGADLDFDVNGVNVGIIKNRWNSNAAGTSFWVEAEDNTIERGKEYYELAWAGDPVVPAVDTLTAAGVANYAIDANDVRFGADLLPVAVGDDIVLSGFDPLQIAYYYVLYDLNNAIESAPSESNIWQKYNVSGLGEMKRAADKLTIKIDDATADGDVIGFRVYAVNYDGTLTDPDGKAFYVQYGKGQTISNSSTEVSFTAVVDDASAIDIAGDGTPDWTQLVVLDAMRSTADYNRTLNMQLNSVRFSDYPANTRLSASSGTLTFSAADYENQIIGAGNTVTVRFWILNSNRQVTTDASAVRYILTSADLAGIWVDGATLEATPDAPIYFYDDDHNGKKIGNLTLKVTKKMPAAPAFAWNTSREPVDGVLSIYPDPSNQGVAFAAAAPTWNTAAATNPAAFAEFAPAAYGTPAAGDNTMWRINATKLGTDWVTYDVVADADFSAVYDDLVPRRTTPINQDNTFVFGTTYPASLGYLYNATIPVALAGNNGPSCYYDAAAEAYLTDQDYYAPVADAQAITGIKFINKLSPSVQHYAFNSYSYRVGKTYDGVSPWDDTNSTLKTGSYFFVWGGVTTATASAAVAAGHLCKFSDAADYDNTDAITGNDDATRPQVVAADAADFFALLKSTNDANMAAGGTTTQLLTRATLSHANFDNWYLPLNADVTNARVYRFTVTAGNTVYYTATAYVAATGVVTFGEDAGVVPPAAKLAGKLNVYAVDVFGTNWNNNWNGVMAEANQAPIMSLDVAIYPNEVYVEY